MKHSVHRALATALSAVALFGVACSPVPSGLPLPATVAPGAESPGLRRIRQVLARVPDVLSRNHKTFAGPKGPIEGFGAGEAYPQIWLRDSAWIVPAAAGDYGPTALLSWLDLHLDAATPDGRLRDWVAIAKPETFREWAPKVAALGPISVDTNTNESDQEPSAALAYCRAVDALRARGDVAAVSGPMHAARLGRLVRAMDALLGDRTDAKSGLVWSGLTADWGDVSPLYPDQRAIYLDAKTPRTLSLYASVMAAAALDCLARLDGPKAEQARLAARATALRNAVRARFWMSDLGYFRVRLPLDPLPEPFRDDTRFALGGNALAALLGIADEAQSASIFRRAEALRAANHFSTIATTLIPPYDAGVFQHPAMKDPFQYQNGGQWDWYGAALIEAEFARGHAEAARRHLDQMVARILHAGPGIHEWYTSDGEAKGSASYAAAAASIHGAIVRGLLGITRSADGVRVTLRTAETVRDFDVPGDDIRITQRFEKDATTVTIRATQSILEVCTLVPPASGEAVRAAAAGAPTLQAGAARDGTTVAKTSVAKRTARTVGADTFLCADTRNSGPSAEVRFTFHR